MHHHLQKVHPVANPIVHWEIAGRNAAELREFYSGVLDWKINFLEDMDGYGIGKAASPAAS